MRKLLLLVTIVITLFTLSGCWGKVEINELATASAIGIDKSEEGYKVTAQVIHNTTFLQGSGESTTPIITLSAQGKTIMDAIRNLTLSYPSKVFLSHFQLLIFSEDYAKEGIGESLYFFFKEPSVRHKFRIAVVKGAKAEDLLKIQTVMKKNPSSEYIAYLKSADQYFGLAYTDFIDGLLGTVIGKGRDPIINTLVIIGDPEKGGETKNAEKSAVETRVKVDGYSVFKEDKLVGFLTQDEGKGYSHTMGLVKNTIIPIVFKEDKLINFEVFGSKVNKKLVIENDKPKIIIKYQVQGSLAYTQSNRENIPDKNIKELEEQTAKKIKESMEASIKKAQEYNSDFLHIGFFIQKQDYQYWKKIEKQYDDIFPEIKFEVNVEAKVARRTY